MIMDPHDVSGNLEKAEAFCRRAAKHGVKILCLPECASTGWEYGWTQDRKLRHHFHAEPIPGPIT